MSRMWTKEHRERQRAFERRRYPTDLTDEEWQRIQPILPEPARRGRKPKVNLREILNDIRYLARTGCGWRMSSGHGRRCTGGSGALSAACGSRPCTISRSCWIGSTRAERRARRLA